MSAGCCTPCSARWVTSSSATWSARRSTNGSPGAVGVVRPIETKGMRCSRACATIGSCSAGSTTSRPSTATVSRAAGSSPPLGGTRTRAYPCARARSAAAAATSMKKPSLAGPPATDCVIDDTTPRTKERPPLSALALGLARYPTCSATRRTWLLVSGLTLPSPRRAWDTVVRETPAALATSAIVGRGWLRSLTGRAYWGRYPAERAGREGRRADGQRPKLRRAPV